MILSLNNVLRKMLRERAATKGMKNIKDAATGRPVVNKLTASFPLAFCFWAVI